MTLNNEKPRAIVADSERSKIDRSVLIWLNTYPFDFDQEDFDELLPISTIKTESQLGANEPCMAISAITSAYINQRYIYGGYQAEYQFTLIYRIKPGKSMDMSLQANQLLNQIGDWAMTNKPDLGEEIRVLKVEPISIAETYANYEDGDEDHHISIRILYEVM